MALARGDEVEGFRELFRRLVTDDPHAADLAAVAVVEHDSRRTEEAEALQERLVLGAHYERENADRLCEPDPARALAAFGPALAAASCTFTSCF
jgi:hypothetical protein